jgi:hypothetical protein
MDRESFIEFLSIDEQGHQPFYLLAEDFKGETTLAAMDLNDVFLVYSFVRLQLRKNPRTIYFTMDFPAGKDIFTDFVGVHFKENEKPWEMIIIPYDKKGNRLPTITKGVMFGVLLEQCRRHC